MRLYTLLAHLFHVQLPASLSERTSKRSYLCQLFLEHTNLFVMEARQFLSKLIRIVFYSGFKGETDLALAEGTYGQVPVLLVLRGTQTYKLVIFLFNNKYLDVGNIPHQCSRKAKITLVEVAVHIHHPVTLF